MSDNLGLLHDRNRVIHAIDHFEIMDGLNEASRKRTKNRYAFRLEANGDKIFTLELNEPWKMDLFNTFLQQLKSQAEIDKKALLFSMHQHDAVL